MDRNSVLLEGLDRRYHSGAEIGPFYSPVAPKRDGWKTIVIDVYDTDTIFSKAQTHDSPEIRSSAKSIEFVDVVWRGEKLDSLSTLAASAPLDYLIASHVIEHVPDIIRFLQGVETLLGESGVLSLAIPDSRFCFDVLRFPSTSGEALRSFREERIRISPETLFEQISYGSHKDQQGAWTKNSHGTLTLMSPFDHAYNTYRNYVHEFQNPTSEYVDCHAWVFTPCSFRLLILELFLMGSINLEVTDLNYDTLGSEFFAKLRRDSGQIARHEREALRLELIRGVRKELSIVRP